MTNEQLERFRRYGIPIDDGLIRLAQIGEENKAKMQAAAKRREEAKNAAIHSNNMSANEQPKTDKNKKGIWIADGSDKKEYVIGMKTDGLGTFAANTVIALNYLASKGAMHIDFEIGNVDVLGKLMGGDVDVNITSTSSRSEYKFETDILSFNSTEGSWFKKDYYGVNDEINIGRNSPAAILGHELVHNYNEKFDYQAKRSRTLTSPAQKRRNAATFPFFPNEEEKLCTTNWGNQINRKLREDERTHYKSNYYPTESPISTKPKTE